MILPASQLASTSSPSTLQPPPYSSPAPLLPSSYTRHARPTSYIASSSASSSNTHIPASNPLPAYMPSMNNPSSSHYTTNATASTSAVPSPPHRSSDTVLPSSEHHPRPYRGRSAPFPIPVGKRSVGGLAALDENAGADVLSQLFGEEKVQPAPLGKTRCYWALCSTDSSPSNPYDLTFLYCDPVLQNHLNNEADGIIGKSFFDFVHPGEKAQARRDLAQIVASGTLFGSVTRCRYFRVPAIREHLGCKKALRVPGSELYTDDDNYLTLDIVLNMVGESLALCFFHAIINLSDQDNDEANKTDWTNWCGTPRALFDVAQCNKLWTSVASLPNLHSSTSPTASHIFQILSLPADASSPEILFSWPPPRFFPDHDEASASPNIEAFKDGSYFADEFARLAQGVRTSPSARTQAGHTARNGEPGTIQDGANTSCTRRFKAKHTLTTEGMVRVVESVLVPYGTIMLAFFKTTYQSIIYRSSGGQYSEFAVSPNANVAPPSSTGSSPLIRQQISGPAVAQCLPPQIAPPTEDGLQNSSKRVVNGYLGGRSSSDFGQWPDVSSPWAPLSTRDSLGSGPISGGMVKAGTATTTASTGNGPDLSEDELRASPPCEQGQTARKQRKRPRKSAMDAADGDVPLSRSLDNDAMKGLIDGTSEIDKRCSSCGTANSPEWRKGPTGQKTLCNACGLRFSRSMNRQNKKAAHNKGHHTQQQQLRQDGIDKIAVPGIGLATGGRKSSSSSSSTSQVVQENNRAGGPGAGATGGAGALEAFYPSTLATAHAHNTAQAKLGYPISTSITGPPPGTTPSAPPYTGILSSSSSSSIGPASTTTGGGGGEGYNEGLPARRIRMEAIPGWDPPTGDAGGDALGNPPRPAHSC